jgi:beta,beta-carotene 9',10'-dioxygenase
MGEHRELGEGVTTAEPVGARLGFTTLASEVDDAELEVRGTLPDWLTGTLVRNGPARFEIGGKRLNHWFDGMAMLHRFALGGGVVRYSNRFLRSQAYNEAEAKGALCRREFATDPCWNLFQRVFTWFSPKFTDNGCVNVAEWGEAAVALTEIRMPVAFDRETLATLGVREYDRRIPGPVTTAHPHFDAARDCYYNCLLDFGWRSQYRLFRIDRETGGQTVVATIPVDRPAYLHSFGMTEHHLVLVEFPLVVNPLKLLLSGKPFICNYRWQPERGVRFHVVAKDSGKVVRTARGPAMFAFHHVNAFEQDGEIVVDMVTHPTSEVIDELYLDRLRAPNPVHAMGSLRRYRIGSSEVVADQVLSEVMVELPRFDYQRRAGRPYRYVYAISHRSPDNFVDSLVKVDLEGRTHVRWREEGCYPGEPVFVAAPDGASEDDGVVLSVVLDARRGLSFLLVLDAREFTELARAEAPHHIPFGFHGSYFPAGG